MKINGKNIALILGIVTIAFGGYYLYTQFLSSDTVPVNEQDLENMLSNTRVFIQRGEQLSSMKIDTSLFEDDRFNSLKTFRTDVITPSVGRPDPFVTADDGNIF